MNLRELRSLKPDLRLSIEEALEGLGTTENGAGNVTEVQVSKEDLVSYLTDAVHEEVLRVLEEDESGDESQD